MQGTEEAKTISVAIVDDHPVFLNGVRATIGDDPSLKLVGEARNAGDAWRIAHCERPQVMLVDVNLGGGPNGLALTDALATYYPAVRVIILSVEDGSGHTRSAYRAGARGYVTKADPSERVIAAIHTVARGESFWPRPELGDQEQPWPTSTEIKVMRILVNQGHNKDVADALGIALATAEAHRLNARRKLGLDTLVEMYRWLDEHGLLVDDDLQGASGDELGARLEAELVKQLSPA
jgi:DNA-binding NarL/FixJ family response regulator